MWRVGSDCPPWNWRISPLPPTPARVAPRWRTSAASSKRWLGSTGPSCGWLCEPTSMSAAAGPALLERAVDQRRDLEARRHAVGPLVDQAVQGLVAVDVEHHDRAASGGHVARIHGAG